MLQEWRKHGITTYAGYILGFPGDTRQSILRDIEIIKKELPVDLLEFFFLTPLPGSEDHKVLLANGVWMDPDLNKYDLNHRASHHPKMSDAEWEQVYAEAWDSYYTDGHMETVIRRAAAVPGGRPHAKMRLMLWFYLIYRIEHLHPLEGGIYRLRYRRDRRPGLPIESPLVFYPKRTAEVISKVARYALMIAKAYRISRRVARDPNRSAYMDLATAPVDMTDMENLAMFHETSGGEAAVAKKKHADALREEFAAQPGE
jgi:hypothetical protein